MEDYGILTDWSKTGNKILGDETGRTISRRTGHGFKKLLAPEIDDKTAEDIVHLLMFSTLILFLMKNKKTFTFGMILLIVLIIFYQIGK